MNIIVPKSKDFFYFKNNSVAVVSKGRIYYNKDYFDKRDPVELQAMIAHERVHIAQQKNKNIWWWELKYYFSKRFRYAMELEAYKAELDYYRENSNSIHKSRAFKKTLAQHMSKYYNMVTYSKAYRDLK